MTAAPRTPWTPPDTWARWRRGDGCAMCADSHLPENEHSFLAAELRRSYVRLPRNQYCRGWTIVALKRHANELFELAPAELAEFWQDVSDVARALQDIYQPAKLNYAIFGNRCPHLHCHLLVQTFADDPTAPIDFQAKTVLLPPTEYSAMIETLRARLQL